MPKIFTFLIGISFLLQLNAQEKFCPSSGIKHTINSKFGEIDRTFWVSLPMHYDTNKSYPVLYVFDAEWRFDLVRHIAWDMAGNKKIPHHIIVGIPHINWKNQRGIDLTFSYSKNEYDGEIVEDGYFNETNSGNGQLFYQYLTQELIKEVDGHYATNKKRILIGHSYGGYFGGYIIPFDTYFSAYQMYDPSVWYNQGEIITNLIEHKEKLKPASIFISYQKKPIFHKTKIEKLIKQLKKRARKNKGMKLATRKFKKETHNSLFMQSFVDGMNSLYSEYKATQFKLEDH